MRWFKMVLLTKEKFNKRKLPYLKAHQWWGSEFIKNDLAKHYDVYIEDDRAIFYILKKEVRA